MELKNISDYLLNSMEVWINLDLWSTSDVTFSCLYSWLRLSVSKFESLWPSLFEARVLKLTWWQSWIAFLKPRLQTCWFGFLFLLCHPFSTNRWISINFTIIIMLVAEKMHLWQHLWRRSKISCNCRCRHKLIFFWLSNSFFDSPITK